MLLLMRMSLPCSCASGERERNCARGHCLRVFVVPDVSVVLGIFRSRQELAGTPAGLEPVLFSLLGLHATSVPALEPVGRA